LKAAPEGVAKATGIIVSGSDDGIPTGVHGKGMVGE